METTTVELTEAKTPGQVTVGDVVSNTTWQVAGIISLLALAIAYKTTFAWEWGGWMGAESEYSHGPLIPIISGFVVWFTWKRLSKIQAEPNLLGLAIVLPSLFIVFAAHRSGAFAMGGMTVPVTVLGMSLLLLGKKATRELLFPILFLFFMCILPGTLLNKISHDIQMESTRFATAGLKLMGLDATREGIFISLPSVTVQVAAACSGIRTLMALLAFSIFFVYMKEGPLWGRLLLVAIVPPLALAVNSLRVLMIALVGEYYGEDAMHAFHDYSGYMVIVIAFIVLIQIAKVVRCRDFISMPTS